MKDEERCNYVEVRSGKRCKGKREPNFDGLFRIMCKKHEQKTSELESRGMEWDRERDPGEDCSVPGCRSNRAEYH